MNSDIEEIVNFLKLDSGVIALTTTARIYGGRSEPPAGYKPNDGSCIVFKRRGRRTIDESNVVLSNSYQFKCYGGGANEAAQRFAADALGRAVYDALVHQSNSIIFSAQPDGGADIIEEPDTKWPYELAFYRVQLKK